jgi:integrase
MSHEMNMDAASPAESQGGGDGGRATLRSLSELGASCALSDVSGRQENSSYLVHSRAPEPTYAVSQKDVLGHPMIREESMTWLTVSFSPEMDERLRKFAEETADYYAERSEEAINYDARTFKRWCGERGLCALPASPATLAAFIEDESAAKAVATIERCIGHIGVLHRGADLPDPTKALSVQSKLRGVRRRKGKRQRQAYGLTYDLRVKMLSAAGGRLIDLRNKAVLAVGGDCGARRSELVEVRVEDLEYAPDGSATVLFRRSKTDQDGAGSIGYVAADSVRILTEWFQAAGIKSGFMFRAVDRHENVGERLGGEEVGRIVKAMATAADLPMVSRISAHSLRVGMAQDMVANGIDMAAIMQHGRWKGPQMVARYSERLLAQRGAGAQLAARQGRN